MIQPIQLILPILSMLDMSMTHYTIVLMNRINPKKNHYHNEMNPLTRLLWHNLGLINGTLVAGTFFICLWFIYSSFLNVKFVYYFCGLFTTVFLIHIKNIIELRRLLK
jgi:hypothetical protein